MRILASLLSLLIAAVASADERVTFEQRSWTLHDPGARVMSYLNRDALYLGDGIATIDDVEFADGTIEFDVALQAYPSFAGFTFRGESPVDFEVIYARPHRSRQPDALQYSPVFGGTEAWQLYVGDGYTAAAELPAGRWLHVKAVIAGYSAQVYFDGATVPQLIVTDLKRPWARGRVGLFGRYGAMFSNVTVTPAASSAPPARLNPAAAPGIISRWRLGPSWDASERTVEEIATGAVASWEPVETEPGGILNIAKYRRQLALEQRPAGSSGRDVTVLKATLVSDAARRVRLTFGYSDAVTILLNGKPLFAGEAGYLSRDSAYLGTVTLGGDSLFLDLLAGPNELTMVVTERFGGWGIAARLEPSGGVVVN